MSSSRSEFQPYSEQGPRRSKTTGFRLVVSAAALNNQDDIAEARAEWDRLGSANAVSSTAAASDDPVKEIQSLTELADAGSAMKERLERLAAKVKRMAGYGVRSLYIRGFYSYAMPTAVAEAFARTVIPRFREMEEGADHAVRRR